MLLTSQEHFISQNSISCHSNSWRKYIQYNSCLLQSSIQLQLSWLGWNSFNFNFYPPTPRESTELSSAQLNPTPTQLVGLIGSRISLKPAWAELGIAQSQLVSTFDQSEVYTQKVVNSPQAEFSEFYNVLKIAWFPIEDEQKYVYSMLVWYDGSLDCLFLIHSPPSSILNSNSSYLHPPTSNLRYPTSMLHLQLFCLHPQSKERDFWLKKSSK